MGAELGFVLRVGRLCPGPHARSQASLLRLVDVHGPFPLETELPSVLSYGQLTSEAVGQLTGGLPRTRIRERLGPSLLPYRELNSGRSVPSC